MDPWILLACLCLVTAAVFYLSDWLGVQPASGTRGMPSLRTASTVFFSVGIFVMRFNNSPAEALQKLAEYIRPYPGATPVESSQARGWHMWKVRTNDPIETVLEFYDDLAARDGWELERVDGSNPWMFYLRGSALEVVVQVTRAPPNALEIAYTVRQKTIDAASVE